MNITTRDALIVTCVVFALLAGTRDEEPAAGAPPAAAMSAPSAFRGTTGGCSATDPSGKGCVAPAVAHAVRELSRVGGGPAASVTATSCWTGPRPWNPASDHPRGRACDLFLGAAGAFPPPEAVKDGWAVANWFRANAGALRVRYVIWQGRIWTADLGGSEWRPYRGGGVYDPADATGGHFDHVHVSFTTS